MAVVRSRLAAGILSAKTLAAEGRIALSALQKVIAKKSEPARVKTLYQLSNSDAIAACGWGTKAVKECWSSKKRVDDFDDTEPAVAAVPDAGGEDWDAFITSSPGSEALARAVDFCDGERTGFVQEVDGLELLQVGRVSRGQRFLV